MCELLVDFCEFVVIFFGKVVFVENFVCVFDEFIFCVACP